MEERKYTLNKLSEMFRVSIRMYSSHTYSSQSLRCWWPQWAAQSLWWCPAFSLRRAQTKMWKTCTHAHTQTYVKITVDASSAASFDAPQVLVNSPLVSSSSIVVLVLSEDSCKNNEKPLMKQHNNGSKDTTMTTLKHSASCVSSLKVQYSSYGLLMGGFEFKH